MAGVEPRTTGTPVGEPTIANLQARYDLDVAERKLRRTIDREVKPRAA